MSYSLSFKSAMACEGIGVVLPVERSMIAPQNYEHVDCSALHILRAGRGGGLQTRVLSVNSPAMLLSKNSGIPLVKLA